MREFAGEFGKSGRKFLLDGIRLQGWHAKRIIHVKMSLKTAAAFCLINILNKKQLLMQITGSFSTKFRAFQLDSPGSLFAYFKPGEYTLIEARIPKGGIVVLKKDLAFHNRERIDVLHITSWDSDHCTYNDLVQILNQLRPNRIEVPGYVPTTEDGKLCYNLIHKYDDVVGKKVQNVVVLDDAYRISLPIAQANDDPHVIFPSMASCDNKNNMSLIKLFRSQGFNVLSLGDCEAPEIAERLIRYNIIPTEVDVLILAHHGADNGFTTAQFIDAINPKIAICSSNNNNMFDHPRPNIRQLFSYRGIPLMTTKRGDVVLYQMEGIEAVVATNMISDNEVVDTREGFIPKRTQRRLANQFFTKFI